MASSAPGGLARFSYFLFFLAIAGWCAIPAAGGDDARQMPRPTPSSHAHQLASAREFPMIRVGEGIVKICVHPIPTVDCGDSRRSRWNESISLARLQEPGAQRNDI